MQLNTLNFKSDTALLPSKPQLAIYDHKLTIINEEIFVFGQNIQHFLIQTPLYKINLRTLDVQPIFTANAPAFEDFLMFSFQQNIYFCGKCSQSMKTQLYQFDGCKFIKLDQSGHIPEFEGSFSFTIFSHKYLILFSCFTKCQNLNKWYIFDISKRVWFQVVSDIQALICERSSLIWINGRGYLLLQSVYLRKERKFVKNLLYQVKFKSFSKLTLTCRQIMLSSEIQDQNIIFTELLSIQGKLLAVLGGEQNEILNQNKQIKINYDFHKIIFKFDLETAEWLRQTQTVKIKGQGHQTIAFNNNVYFIGGHLQSKLLSQVQHFTFQKIVKNQFPYEQSICYYCQCAFSYTQSLIYQPLIQKQYEKYCPRNKIQNKFLTKYAKTIENQIQAIGILCKYFIRQKFQSIKITLCQSIQLQPSLNKVKQKIQNPFSQVLQIKCVNDKYLNKETLISVFTNEKHYKSLSTQSNFYVHFTQLKLACFKLGVSFLFVTSISDKEVFVGYSSYSQTDFPQSNFVSLSQNYYFIQLNLQKHELQYSSSVNRHIIFQNVKLYFGNFQAYESTEKAFMPNSRGDQKLQSSIYILGVQNIQKSLNLQIDKSSYYQDIKIKNLPKNNAFNSLRNYLRHSYLMEGYKPNIYLQNQAVCFSNLYEIFTEYSKSHFLKRISTNEDKLNKNEGQDTHFSTNGDQSIVLWKKPDLIDRCKIYSMVKEKQSSISQLHRRVFLYRNKQIVKSIKSKKGALCGIIQIRQDVQMLINESNFANKRDEKSLISWLEQIQKSTFSQSIANGEEE